jgi:NADH:ubiquinone oxidoreductase subunit K
MIYHGSVQKCDPYFTALGYTLPPGESIADWLIDISTGRIAADVDVDGRDSSGRASGMRAQLGLDHSVIGQRTQDPLGGYKPARDATVVRRHDERERGEASYIEQRTLSIAHGSPTIIGGEAVTSGQKGKADEDAVLRREVLYASWIEYFEGLSDDELAEYTHPVAGGLPKPVQLPHFGIQFQLQMARMFLLGWRNRFSKTIECVILVVAVVLVTLGSGTVTLTRNSLVQLVPFEALISGQNFVLPEFFRSLFEFALSPVGGYVQYALSLGVIASVLIALTSVKAITDKRLEFFREASSGYSSNAYFLAVNVFTTIDQGVQVLFAAIIAQWLRDSVSGRTTFYLAFLMLAWISVSWSLLIPLIAPPSNTLVILGAFMAFFGLLFSGGLAPVEYKSEFFFGEFGSFP